MPLASVKIPQKNLANHQRFLRVSINESFLKIEFFAGSVVYSMDFISAGFPDAPQAI
jgi:hypothetical protein